MRDVFFAGLGAFVPEERITNADFERMVDTSDEWIVTRTGIRERRRAPAGMVTSDLCLEASRKALAAAGCEASDLDLVVVGTTSPDIIFPSTACILADKLGTGPRPAFDLQAACSGWVYAATLARHGIAAGGYDRVLCVGAEILTRFVDYEDRTTCILFGDGAGAAVLSSDGGHRIVDARIGADLDRKRCLTIPGGGTLHPTSEETVAKRLHTIKMQGREVFKVAGPRLLESVTALLELNGLGVDDITLFVPHQMNVRIMQYCSDRLGLPMERIYVNIDRYGNTSAASIPIALDEADRTGRLRPGDRVLLATFGGGYTWGTMLLEW